MWYPAPSPFWHAVSRLGEAQVMLPAAFAVMLWLALRPSARPLAGWWLLTMSVAVAITTASKVAFLGYGWGSAEFDFTGASGHAMFSAVVYPLLLWVLVAAKSVTWQRGALGLGTLVSAMVGVSRLMTGAHSMSEVLAGWALGGAAVVTVLMLARPPAARMPAWLPLAVPVMLLCVGTVSPPSNTHDLVIRLSLKLSGRQAPYTREDLQRSARPFGQYELTQR